MSPEGCEGKDSARVRGASSVFLYAAMNDSPQIPSPYWLHGILTREHMVAARMTVLQHLPIDLRLCLVDM